eukprot:m.47341 g.47341  ORF g.47341 m.47341 type:complete len:1232 (-) comp7324_c0_seq2:794-4489(-)
MVKANGVTVTKDGFAKATLGMKLVAIGGFAIHLTINSIVHSVENHTINGIASIVDFIFAVFACAMVFLLLWDVKLIQHSRVWNLVHIDELLLFAFCFVAFQFLDIHTEIYSYLDDDLFTSYQFALGIARRCVITIIFIALLPYVYHTHHGVSESASKRERYVAMFLCGFGLAEALDMILLPAVAEELYLTIIENTNIIALWLNFGLIRPLAVVYTLDTAVCVAYGTRHWPRIIFRPHVIKGSFHSNNPSLGIAMFGIFYIGMLLFGHYGINISPIFTIAFSFAEAIIAIGLLAWLFFLYILPNCGQSGLRSFFSLDRFTYVLMFTCVGLICACVAWMIIIPKAIIDNNTVVFSDHLTAWQILFGLHIVDAIMHVIVFLYAFNGKDKHQRTVANYYTYAVCVFLLLHNLCLWLLNTDYEISISLSVEEKEAKILEGMWPLVVEFRMVCVALFGLIIVHKPGWSSKHAVAPLTNTLKHALLGTKRFWTEERRKLDVLKAEEDLSYAAPTGRVNIDFVYFTPKPWYWFLTILTFLLSVVFTVVGTNNFQPVSDPISNLFFINDVCVLFSDVVHDAVEESNHTSTTTTTLPLVEVYDIHPNVQVAFFLFHFFLQLSMIAALVRLIWKTAKPLSKALSIPVRVQIIYVLACGSFVYRLDASMFSLSPDQWPDENIERFHRVLEGAISVLDLIIMVLAIFFTMYISQLVAHLKGEDFLNTKYNFTRQQWMVRYVLAGYLISAGVLELFLGSYGGSRLLEYTEAINERHRLLFLGILRFVNVFTSVQLGFLMLPTTLMKATINVIMGQLRTTKDDDRDCTADAGEGNDVQADEKAEDASMSFESQASSALNAMKARKRLFTIIRQKREKNKQGVESVVSTNAGENIVHNLAVGENRRQGMLVPSWYKDTLFGEEDGNEGAPITLEVNAAISAFGKHGDDVDNEEEEEREEEEEEGDEGRLIRENGADYLELRELHENLLDGTRGERTRTSTMDANMEIRKSNGLHTPIHDIEREIEFEEAATVLPLSFIIPAIVLGGYILGIQYGACKTVWYSSIAWIFVSVFNVLIALYLIGMYYKQGGGYHRKFVPNVLENRRGSYGVIPSMVIVFIIIAVVNLVLLALHDHAQSVQIVAEVMRRVDLVFALVVCLFCYNRREKRQRVHLYSNRAYVLSLLLAASQFAIFLSTLGTYVRLNSPGVLHTRLPVIDHWAIGLYPFTLLARLSVGLLLGRLCVGIREAS